MRYQKLRDGLSTKLRKTSRYRGLMMNEVGAIFPGSKWHIEAAAKEGRIYSDKEAQFAFYPDDICVLNKIPLATYDLVPFGMTGKFAARQTDKSEYTYIFELFDKYEAFPAMRVSMIDGKPLEARLLNDIEYHPERLKKFKTRVKEMKNVMFVMNRMADETDLDRHRKYWDWEKRVKMHVDRREMMFKLLSSKTLPKDWIKKLIPYYSWFWSSAYRSIKDHNKVFDNMVRYDKAALFRNLKVIE